MHVHLGEDMLKRTVCSNMIKIDALRPAEKNETKNGWSVPIIYQNTLAKFENNFENNFDNNFFEKYMGHIVLLHLQICFF